MLDPQRFLEETYPFSELPKKEIIRLSSNLLIRYYAKGEVIFKEQDPPLEFLYLIRKGAVYLKKESITIDQLYEGDSLGYESLLGNSPPLVSATASEDTILFMIPKSIFLKLVEDYESFKNFYTKKLVERLNKKEPSIKVSIESWATLPIQTIKLSPPVFVEGEENVYQVVSKMINHGTTCVIVREGKEEGIITERDLIKKVLGERKNPRDVKAKEVASFPLISMSPDAPLFEAIMLMSKHNIRRIVVKEGKNILGILEDKDLIAYESKSLLFLSKDIGKAKNVQELAYFYSLAFSSAIEQIKIGTDPELIGKYISEINDKIMQRLVYITIKEVGLEPPTSFCILVLGSEGRKEQSLKTDQDNALVYEEMPLLDLSVSEYFDRFSEAYINNLIKVGFPPCPGGVMLSNSSWRGSKEEWKKRIDRWIENPKGENVLNISMLIDMRSAFGDKSLEEELRSYLFKRVKENPSFLPFLASEAVRFKVPLGFFREFVVERAGEHKGELDLKAGGIFPLLHGIRVLSLEHLVESTNTFDRIRELRAKGVFSESFAKDLLDAYRFLMELRLRFQAKSLEEGKEPNNYINPNLLSRGERTALKDAFKVVSEFQELLSHKYNLRYFT